MAVLALLLVSTAAARARAGDAYEIQVYDGTANPVGFYGLELHLNDWASGHREATPPEAPLHGQFHATLEPSFGLMPFWELGAYFQTVLRTDDGRFDWAGAKLRSKFVTPPRWDPHWRLGVNVEIAYLPEAYDRDRWGSEIRPIAAWHSDAWLFALNPILDQSLAGSGASDGPSLQPALKVARTIGPVALGFEYYGTLGPLVAPLPWRQEEHYVFETFDLVGLQHLELNIGLGEGLTEVSAGIVVKAIVGYTFEPPPTRSPREASYGRRRMQ
jgi:hypothetical protein